MHTPFAPHSGQADSYLALTQPFLGPQLLWGVSLGDNLHSSDSEPQDSTGLFRDRAGARQEGVVASGRVSGAERVPARVEVIVLLARWVGSPEHRPAVAAVHQRNDAENGDGDQQSCYDSLARLRAARALRRRHSSDPLRSKVMRPSWREQTPQAPARSPAPSKTCKRW